MAFQKQRRRLGGGVNFVISGQASKKSARFFLKFAAEMWHVGGVRRILQTWLLLTGAFLCLAADAAPTTQARLVLSADEAKPGGQIWAGVHLRMAKGWHTYWRYGGDAAVPTTVEWQLPPGIAAGEILWPLPEKIETDGLFSYVYHDEVYLLVPLKLSQSVAPGRYELKAKVEWLECKTSCLPGDARVSATLTVGDSSRNSIHAETLEKWRQKVPAYVEKPPARAWWGESDKEGRTLIIEWQTGAGWDGPDFFPLPDDTFTIGGETASKQAGNGQWRLQKLVKRSDNAGWPGQIHGVLVAFAQGQPPKAMEILLPIAASETAPPPVLRPKEAGQTMANAQDARTSRPGLGKILTMVLFAFIGGLILNVMPCVLPVIALKILGFVEQSKETPGRIRVLGLMYGLGVVVSMMVLAGALILLKTAGKAVSWGQQFQSPPLIIGMMVLVTLVALNLFGVFEVNPGGRALEAASSLASRQGNRGAFFHGLLTTVLATPCTAPILGAAVGFALTQSHLMIALIFLFVGLGLAGPYVLLCWHPAWMRWLPKPGAWMETFKKALGFPMLATTAWLLSLVVGAYGPESALWLGIFLVLLALAAWIFGEFIQRSTGGRMWIKALVLALVIACGIYLLEAKVNWRSPPAGEAAGDVVQHKPDGIVWQRWSPEKVAKARAEGRPVLVDFTAPWCLTCQLNAKTSIEIPEVKQKLAQINAVALIEDSRTKNATVIAELNRWGRAGVPLVLVYPRDSSRPPEVLPELLTPKIVLDALDRAAR